MIKVNRSAIITGLLNRISSEANTQWFEELRNGLPNEQMKQPIQFSLYVSDPLRFSDQHP